MGGGTVPAIRAIMDSGMTPGPLGMEETRPRADAPQTIAAAASSGVLIQQILTRGRHFMCLAQFMAGVPGPQQPD